MAEISTGQTLPTLQHQLDLFAFAEPFLTLDGCSTTLSNGGSYLPEIRVLNLASGKDAFDAGSHFLVSDDVPMFVHRHMSF